MKLINNKKKYLQQKFSRKVLVSQTTAYFTSRDSKSYVPFTCKFPMVMHFVPILYKRCRSKTNFHVFSYDKTSLKFCASFRFFLAVFMEKFQKIRYLNYVRRGIVYFWSLQTLCDWNILNKKERYNLVVQPFSVLVESWYMGYETLLTAIFHIGLCNKFRDLSSEKGPVDSELN